MFFDSVINVGKGFINPIRSKLIQSLMEDNSVMSSPKERRNYDYLNFRG